MQLFPHFSIIRRLSSLIHDNVLKEDRKSTQLHRKIKLNFSSGILHIYSQGGSYAANAFPGGKPEKLPQREVSEDVLEQSQCLKSQKQPGMYGLRQDFQKKSDQLQTPMCNLKSAWKVTDVTPIDTKNPVAIWTAYGQQV